MTRSRYESRQCRRCDRDFLFPTYGWGYVCNDCMWRGPQHPPRRNEVQ